MRGNANPEPSVPPCEILEKGRGSGGGQRGGRAAALARPFICVCLERLLVFAGAALWWLCWRLRLLVVCENGRASFDGTVAQRTACPVSGRCPPTVSPPALWAPSWPRTRPPRPPSLCVPPLLLSRLCFHSSALSSSHPVSLTALSSPRCPPPPSRLPPPSWSRAANEEPRLVWLSLSGGCVQRRPASALVTGCWGCDITQGPAVDLALSPRLAGLMAGGRYSSSPPSSSCSLSLCDTHSSPAPSLYTPLSSRILPQSSTRAGRRQLAGWLLRSELGGDSSLLSATLRLLYHGN